MYVVTKIISKFDEKLKERFLNTYKLSNQDKNKSILMLQKGVYTYEYMDHWEGSMKHRYLKKEEFYSNLNMDDITGADCAHTKSAFKDSEVKKLGEYHGSYLQSDTLLLVDVFENIQNMCLEIYELDPCLFFYCTRFRMRSSF